MARILITGGSGRIGTGVLQRLNEIFSPDDEIFLLKHASPLGAYPDGFKSVKVIETIQGKFDFSLHIAAQADTNFCKKPENREAVLDTNVRLTEKVCQNSAFTLLVSTDNVFDGNSQSSYDESDTTKPCNLYGESKVLAEQSIVRSLRGAVVRISTILGVKNKIIDDGALCYIQGHDHLPFWNNTYVRPSYLDDFIHIVKKMIRVRFSGIFHCSCTGRTFSRAEMAKFALKFYQDHNLPTTRTSIPEEECPAKFPHRLVLSTDRTRKILDLEFTDSQVALEKHLSATLL